MLKIRIFRILREKPDFPFNWQMEIYFAVNKGKPEFLKTVLYFHLYLFIILLLYCATDNITKPSYWFSFRCVETSHTLNVFTSDTRNLVLLYEWCMMKQI